MREGGREGGREAGRQGGRQRGREELGFARIGGSDRYRGGVELSAGSTHSLIQQAPPEAQPAGLSRPAHTAKGEEVLLAAVWEPEGERRGRRRRV